MKKPLAFQPITFSATAASFLLSTFANAEISIESIEITGNQIQITAQSTGTSNAFSLHTSTSLKPNQWTPLTGINFSTNGSQISTTLTNPGGNLRFFRIVGNTNLIGTPDDLDGDGLPNDFETGTVGTNPNNPDSDEDGFNDDFEYAAGTDPNNINDFPTDQRSLPGVEFSSSISSLTEGEPTLSIPLDVDPSFSGTIHYRVSSRSSAISGIDFSPLSGTTTASGGTATINVSAPNDLTVDPEKLLILEILPDQSGSDYRTLGGTAHVICMQDNDAYWNGILVDDTLQRSFRVCIAQDDNNTEIVFTSGNADGLIDLDGGTSSQSTGVIPRIVTGTPPNETVVQTFPNNGATAATFSPSIFAASVINLPVDAGGATGQLVRSLSFISRPDLIDSHAIEEAAIVGTFLEQLRHATDPNITYLDRTSGGTFSLYRDIPDPIAVNSPLDPTD